MSKLSKPSIKQKTKKVHPDDMWMNEQYRGITELGPIADAIKQFNKKREK